MVQFRNQEKEIIFKVVYYGPALGGKTTNIETLHEITDPEGFTKVTSLKTSEDRTLFFDLLPFDLGEIQGYHIRVQIYTVPGQVHYNTTRKIVLSGADSIVFVADSQAEKLEENFISWENMKGNLLANKMNFDDTPIVIQCNKRDCENIASPEKVLEKMKLSGWKLVILSSAIDGQGVVETFRTAVGESLAVFVGKFRLMQKGVTRDRINGSLATFFEPFEKKRLAASELGKPALQATVPITGLSEEEQLTAALKATTELAEQHNEIERLSKLNQVRLREMTLLYDIGVSIAPLKDNASLVLSALRMFSQSRPSWNFSLFRSSPGKVEALGCFGADEDPLFGMKSVPAKNIALGLIGKKEPARIDDLPGRLEAATGSVAAIPESVASLMLGDPADPSYAVLVYASTEEMGKEEAGRSLALLEKLLSPKIVANSLAGEIAKANGMLERKVIERTAELSRAFEKLRELDGMKRAFMDGASGEMKTPVAIIKSQSELLLRHPDQWFDKGKECLTAIAREADRLESLVTHILSFSRVTEPFTGKPCDLAGVLDEVLLTLTPRMKARKVQAVVQKDSDSIVFPINGDDASVLIRQLVDNAVKFTPEGTAVKIFLMEDAKRVIFSVRDYGEGFPKGQTPADLKIEGTGGRGLLLVREVLEKYSGSMHIDPMEPGTIVLVELPKN